MYQSERPVPAGVRFRPRFHYVLRPFLSASTARRFRLFPWRLRAVFEDARACTRRLSPRLCIATRRFDASVRKSPPAIASSR